MTYCWPFVNFTCGLDGARHRQCGQRCLVRPAQKRGALHRWRVGIGEVGYRACDPGSAPPQRRCHRGRHLPKSNDARPLAKRTPQGPGTSHRMVFQDSLAALHPLQTVGNQVAEAIRVHHRDVRARTARARAVELSTSSGSTSRRIREAVPVGTIGGHAATRHDRNGDRQ